MWVASPLHWFGVILQTVPLQHSFALAAVFSGVWDRLCCLSRCHVTLIPGYNPHSACLVSTLHSFLIIPLIVPVLLSGPFVQQLQGLGSLVTGFVSWILDRQPPRIYLRPTSSGCCSVLIELRPTSVFALGQSSCSGNYDFPMCTHVPFTYQQ
jgi:hypothetical protein